MVRRSGKNLVTVWYGEGQPNAVPQPSTVLHPLSNSRHGEADPETGPRRLIVVCDGYLLTSSQLT